MCTRWLLLVSGDFAVLVNSGMSISQAAFFNFVSALACFAGELHVHEFSTFMVPYFCNNLRMQQPRYRLHFTGLYVGIPVSTGDDTKDWIFIVTAGLFIYIALADMVS